MECPSEFQAPKVPRIREHELSGDERQIATSVSANLTNLKRHYDEFASSFLLRAYMEPRYREEREEIWNQRSRGEMTPSHDCVYFRWINLAFRSGGMAARDFVFALERLQSLPGRVASWCDGVDSKAIKAARSDFDALFPGIERVRHTIAHPEVFANPEGGWRVSGKIPAPGLPGVTLVDATGGSAQINMSIIGDHYLATHETGAVSYELSEQTTQSLLEITTQVFGAFEGISVRR